MNQNEIADLHIHQVEADFLTEIAIIDHSDISCLYFNDFCGDRDAHD
jgi:hypothetical protein